MDKIDIFSSVLGVLSFIGMYWLTIVYVGPFVGGLVGFVVGLLALVLVKSLVMVIGRNIEGRNV